MHFYLPTPRNRSNTRRYGVERREFLRYLAMVSAIPQLSLQASGPIEKSFKFQEDPFSLGVTSGDPSSDGVVLWTRLSSAPLQLGGLPNLPIEVQWEISEDEKFSKTVQKVTQ